MKSRCLLLSVFVMISLQLAAQDTCLPKYALPVHKLMLDNKVEMAYVEKGRGKVLLFVHGLGGNISHWMKSIELLSAHYRCIAVDLPGYGYSASQNQNNPTDQLAFYADATVQLTRKLKIKSFDIIGHSMGGQVAVIAGLAYPKNIRRLVLVNPAGLETFTASEATLLNTYTTTAFFKGQDDVAIRASFKNNFFEMPAETESLIQYRLKLKTCPGADNYYGLLVKGVKGMLDHPVKKSLSQLTQQVLLVMGEKDNLIPNKLLHPTLTQQNIIKVATDSVPRINVTVVPNAGHMLPFEKPLLFCNAIKEFLK